MKVVSVGLSALFAGSYAQQASVLTDLSQVKWTEISPEGTKDDSGNIITQSDPQNLFVEIQTQAEMDTEQADIVEYRKKFDGIYDLNMYPYGPNHEDTRIPNADDAVSDPITLPSPFPLFENTFTNQIRATSNGLIALSDAAITTDTPQDFGNNDIDSDFVAGFWNDIWSKKHGRMYYRLETLNDTLLEEMRTDIETGLPNFGPNPTDGIVDTLEYAFILSFWRVTHFGAIKNDDQLQNTFQIVLTTDGTHSFMVLNYQDVQWGQRNVDFPFAAAGYDINQFNSGDKPEGTGTNGVLNWEATTTNAQVDGRHIFQLDNNPIQPHPSNHPCDSGLNSCVTGNTASCDQNGDDYTCTCEPGFTGEFCESVDQCATNNCQNGATCDPVDGSCDCAAGFVGDDCENMDLCFNNNCENGATCNPVDGSCDCAAGFVGDNCENADLCFNNNCENGATCNPADGSCDCADGFFGDDCESVDQCANNNCQNGATCDPVDGSCDCAAGFVGVSCESVDQCLGNNNNGCANGAACDSVTGACGPCPQGFEGDKCQYNDNPCATSNSCQAGETCINSGNGATSCSTKCTVDCNKFDNQWPGNDNCQENNPAGCLAGAIGSYTPQMPLGNGTCTITFPVAPEFFHIFDAHVRADSASIPNQWSVCAANEHFEPGHDGAFQYLVYFAPGSEFSAEDVAWQCDSTNEYEYAVYSFPQRYLEKDGRTNIRHLSSHEGNSFHATVVVSLGDEVANFTVDDTRILVETADNTNFVLTSIPDTFEELWFQWDYLPGKFFLSNTVGVTGN